MLADSTQPYIIQNQTKDSDLPEFPLHARVKGIVARIVESSDLWVTGDEEDRR